MTSATLLLSTRCMGGSFASVFSAQNVNNPIPTTVFAFQDSKLRAFRPGIWRRRSRLIVAPTAESQSATRSSLLIAVIDNMPFMWGPAPIRRTLQYLNSGALRLKSRVCIIEMHYNMYWRYQKVNPSMTFHQPKMKESVTQAMVRDRIAKKMDEKANTTFDRQPDNHTGMREFYFWDVPRLQYQNPDVQLVRFLEKSPLPFLRIWLNDGADVLIDCDDRDRLSILNQLIRTLGTETSAMDADALKKSRARSVSALPMTDATVGNPATFGFSRSRFCPCEVPEQVPCPSVCPLPMRMRGKYTRFLKEELESWENDLDRPYPTSEEMETERASWPEKHPPIMADTPGLDQMFMRKPKQQTRPFTLPEKIAAKYNANRFEKESDRKLFDEHK